MPLEMFNVCSITTCGAAKIPCLENGNTAGDQSAPESIIEDLNVIIDDSINV